MEIKEIAKKLVDLCRKGKNAEAKSLFYSKDIVSIEPNGEIVKGYEATIEKAKVFRESIEKVNNIIIGDPIYNSFGFAVAMYRDITYKSGENSVLEEICIYEVKDGKIVFEQFFFH